MFKENPIHQTIIEDLEKIQLTDEWQQFTNACKDQFRDLKQEWLNSPWGKIINGRRVFVVLSFEGAMHSTWKLYVDGVFIRELKEVMIHMGSGRNAMLAAEKEVL
jgi:hypothetical protein